MRLLCHKREAFLSSRMRTVPSRLPTRNLLYHSCISAGCHVYAWRGGGTFQIRIIYASCVYYTRLSLLRQSTNITAGGKHTALRLFPSKIPVESTRSSAEFRERFHLQSIGCCVIIFLVSTQDIVDFVHPKYNIKHRGIQIHTLLCDSISPMPIPKKGASYECQHRT